LGQNAADPQNTIGTNLLSNRYNDTDSSFHVMTVNWVGETLAVRQRELIPCFLRYRWRLCERST
jgi:hypothetical protein